MGNDVRLEWKGGRKGNKGRHTSAAAAALLRASPAAPPACPACPADAPPSVRGGPPTFGAPAFTVFGTDAVPAGAGAEPTGRPWPAKLSDEALLQRLPIALRAARVCSSPLLLWVVHRLCELGCEGGTRAASLGWWCGGFTHGEGRVSGAERRLGVFSVELRRAAVGVADGWGGGRRLRCQGPGLAARWLICRVFDPWCGFKRRKVLSLSRRLSMTVF